MVLAQLIRADRRKLAQSAVFIAIRFGHMPCTVEVDGSPVFLEAAYASNTSCSRHLRSPVGVDGGIGH